jgi:hypothetical protein
MRDKKAPLELVLSDGLGTKTRFNPHSNIRQSRRETRIRILAWCPRGEGSRLLLIRARRGLFLGEFHATKSSKWIAQVRICLTDSEFSLLWDGVVAERESASQLETAILISEKAAWHV